MFWEEKRREGAVKSQYLTLYAETDYHVQAVCESIDYFIRVCKRNYGEVCFTKLTRNCDPYDRRYPPKRADRPVFTSLRAVNDMRINVNPGIK